MRRVSSSKSRTKLWCSSAVPIGGSHRTAAAVISAALAATAMPCCKRSLRCTSCATRRAATRLANGSPSSTPCEPVSASVGVRLRLPGGTRSRSTVCTMMSGVPSRTILASHSERTPASSAIHSSPCQSLHSAGPGDSSHPPASSMNTALRSKPSVASCSIRSRAVDRNALTSITRATTRPAATTASSRRSGPNALPGVSLSSVQPQTFRKRRRLARWTSWAPTRSTAP